MVSQQDFGTRSLRRSRNNLQLIAVPPPSFDRTPTEHPPSTDLRGRAVLASLVAWRRGATTTDFGGLSTLW